jgi:hypothetical protein
MNKEWHLKNRMPKNPTLSQRIRWHTEHKKHCGCRPIPDRLLKLMKKKPITDA